MKINVEYQVSYSYKGRVSLSRQEFRILPRQDHYLRVEHFALECRAAQSLFYRRDMLDNEFVCAFFPQSVENVKLKMNFKAFVTERNPYNFLLDNRAEKMPVRLNEEEKRALSLYLKRMEGLDFPKTLKMESGTETVMELARLCHWHFEHIRYEYRKEGEAWSASETLARGCGSCRDSTVLFAEVLRANGIPARLVSGFLAKSLDADSDTRAENALHAWVEAFLPGAGWIGCDPTNGVLCDHHYIATATGPESQSIAPISGAYFSETKMESQLDADVKVIVEA